MTARLLPRCSAFVALGLLLAASPAHAQLGNLLKKKLGQATGTAAPAPAGQPVKFDNVILEITPDRITRLIAAKRFAKQYADGPNGPAALEARANQLDAQQAAIYEKQATNINDWDAKRGDYERCLDSALAAGRAHSIPSAPDLQKMMEFGMAMAAAQQRGDTAEVRRIIAAVEKAKAPTRADTLAAVKVCGPPPAPSAIIKQWYQLKAQLDSLGPQKTAAEDSVRAREEGLSGMNGRQSAVFCERIKAYIAQLKARQKNEYAFTDDEIKTMTNLAQAIKDLEALCP